MLLQENVLFEAEKTCDFICQLSSYLPQWRVSSPESVHQLQVIPRPLGQFLLNSMDNDGCIDNIYFSVFLFEYNICHHLIDVIH